MKVWRYIQGNRKGKEAHRIEKEAMNDPFLADALEGYEKTQGNHQREVAKLQKEINRRQKHITNNSLGKKTNYLKALGIAASILIVVGIGTWFALDDSTTQYNLYEVEINAEEVAESITISPTPMDTTDSAMDMADSAEKTIPPKSVIAQAKTVTDEKKDVQIPEPIVIVEEEPAYSIGDAEIMQKQSIEVQPDNSTEDIMMRVATDTSVSTTKVDNPNPQPVVGMEAYMGYIQRNLKRPTDDECRNAKGSVIVVFKIGQSGRPYNIKVTQGLCPSTNKEAIRLIINGPDWKKGVASDEATITINF